MITKLTKNMIDKAFEKATTQQDWFLELFHIVVPNFDSVITMNHFPQSSEATAHYIFVKAREYDIAHHPNVVPAGLWFNYGFTINNELDDWQVFTDLDKIEYL